MVRKCSAMLPGLTALRHWLLAHNNTPYSTFNAINWLNAGAPRWGGSAAAGPCWSGRSAPPQSATVGGLTLTSVSSPVLSGRARAAPLISPAKKVGIGPITGGIVLG